jgi:hypothetical protein
VNCRGVQIRVPEARAAVSAEFERHISDLVKKERSSVSKLETPDTLIDRARERAALVSEKFGFEKSWQGSPRSLV